MDLISTVLNIIIIFSMISQLTCSSADVARLADKLAAAAVANAQQQPSPPLIMKPSIDQWSEQQDMFVEPDQAVQHQQPYQTIKPSSDRWSHWHDMSMEPDLAACESSTHERRTPMGNVHVAAAPAQLGGVKQPPRQPVGTKRAGPNKRRTVVVRRFGSPAKVVKRRRVKTQLPVGLSSWFLGGIRNLEGRHWRLPNEVISRLAVNDVDLAGGAPAGSLPHKPVPGSVVIVRQVTPAPVNRTPVNQLIPR